jgi:hypothetical protein
MIGKTAPDLVIVGFFLGNDVGEDYFYTQKAHVAGQSKSVTFDDQEWPWSAIEQALDRQNPAPAGAIPAYRQNGGLRHFGNRFLGHSQVVRVLRSLRHRQEEQMRYQERRMREFALVQEHRGDIRYDLGLVNYPAGTQQQRMEHWATTNKCLADIASICQSHGFPMILLVIPPFERLSGQTSFDEPYEVLNDFGREHDVPVVQLLKRFLQERPEAIYYPFDRHWNPRGNRIAAEVLDGELRRLKVLPEEAARKHPVTCLLNSPISDPRSAPK